MFWARCIGVSFLCACSTTLPTSDAAIDAGPCNGNPVSTGGKFATPCAVENATGCGLSAQCSDSISPQEVTCTCRKGIWDCNKCADCNMDLRGPQGKCFCSVCQGGSVTRCDGVTVPVLGCYCGCGMGEICEELDAAIVFPCHEGGTSGDAGSDG